MNTQEKTLFAGWTFKGQEIPALSISRRNHAINIVSGMSAGPTMFAAVVYAATAKKSDLMKGLRNPDWFLEKVSDWMEEVELVPDDYEALGIIFKEMIENTESNRAAPITDPNMMDDPLGNE
jgi:hypothetical protein